MSFLFVIDSLGSGGAQRQMVTLAIKLKERGYKIDFFVYYPEFTHFNPVLHEANIQIHSVQKKDRNPLKIIKPIRSLIASRQYKLVLSFLDGPNLYTEIARIGQQHTKLVVSERFMYPPGKLPKRYWLTQNSHRLADFITVNSHHQRARMEDEYSWMSNKIRTIYNGVDLSLFSPKESLSSKHEVNELRFIVLSSLQPKKNASGLIKAMAAMKEKNGSCPQVDWAGQKVNSPEGIEHFNHLESLLKKYRLSNHWTWLGERNDIHELLPVYDALLHPSYFEGLPNAICEGLASGLPILASITGDHSRLVTSGLNGFLFDPDNPQEIAETLMRFADLDPTSRKRMGRASRKYAEEVLSVERFVDQYYDLFQSLLMEG